MTPPTRLRPRAPVAVDAALALLAFAVMAISAQLVSAKPGGDPQSAFGVLLLAVQALAVMARRQRPVIAYVVAGAAAAVYGIATLPDPFTQIGILIVVGTYVSNATSRTRAALLVALTLAVACTSAWLAGDSDGLDYFSAVAFISFAALLGELARSRREYLREVEQRLTRSDADRRAAAEHAVANERTRIARELHDVVAHHVSMMVVQSEAAASRASDPATFDAISTTGRAALTELRRLVTVLRDDSARAPIGPQPGIADLPHLAAQVRTAGLAVTLRVEGEPRPVAPGVDLSAYRIVQEALTNTIKHAGPAHADVVVRWCPDAIELCVLDDGIGPATAPITNGHGLVGIGERVALFGGSWRIGPGPKGGFAVAARLPTGPP